MSIASKWAKKRADWIKANDSIPCDEINAHNFFMSGHRKPVKGTGFNSDCTIIPKRSPRLIAHRRAGKVFHERPIFSGESVQAEVIDNPRNPKSHGTLSVSNKTDQVACCPVNRIITRAEALRLAHWIIKTFK